MSIGVQVTGTQELERYQQLLETLSDPKHKVELLDSLGGIVESQTRRRIADEKTSPDGQRWDDWSSSYAKTRHGNQSLLQADGDLLDSIQYQVQRNQVRIDRHWLTLAFIKMAFLVRFKSLLIRALSHKPLVKRWRFRSISL